jgi:hypothetical protein
VNGQLIAKQEAGVAVRAAGREDVESEFSSAFRKGQNEIVVTAFDR